MIKMKAAIQRQHDQWLLAFNAIDIKADGRGKRISSLLTYLLHCKSEKEAYENLGVILRGRCPCLLDTAGRKFKRVAEQQEDNTHLFEWIEIKE